MCWVGSFQKRLSRTKPQGELLIRWIGFSFPSMISLMSEANLWIADFGATWHMTMHKNWFTTFEKLQDDQYVLVIGSGYATSLLKWQMDWKPSSNCMVCSIRIVERHITSSLEKRAVKTREMGKLPLVLEVIDSRWCIPELTFLKCIQNFNWQIQIRHRSGMNT